MKLPIRLARCGVLHCRAPIPPWRHLCFRHQPALEAIGLLLVAAISVVLLSAAG